MATYDDPRVSILRDFVVKIGNVDPHTYDQQLTIFGDYVGQFYFNISSKKLYVWVGDRWLSTTYQIDNSMPNMDLDIRKLYQKQQISYRCYIWETDARIPKSIIKADKHVRLNVIDAGVTVADNSYQDQAIQIVSGGGRDEITDRLTIAPSYAAGVSIPLNIRRKTIGYNEQVNVLSSTSRRVIVDLLCESNE